jgi:hypothetical protein
MVKERLRWWGRGVVLKMAFSGNSGLSLDEGE